MLGAGFAGMGAAQRLREHGVDVSVLEGSDRVGGRAHTMEVHSPAWACVLQLAASCTSRFARCSWAAWFRLCDRTKGQPLLPHPQGVTLVMKLQTKDSGVLLA